MPADRRLTIETVKPGMKVKPIGALRVYHVRDVDVGGHLNLEEHDGVYRIEDFIPADPEPAPSWATEELRKALLA